MSDRLRAAVRSARDTWPTEQRRPMAFARGGMVASAHPLAATAGARVLAHGGNAVDAAIATGLVEGVALPWACGLGGDLFGLVHEAGSGRVWSICGAGATPSAASADDLLHRGLARIPVHGGDGITVPGALDAFLVLHERFGSMPFDQLAAPAIALAAEGLAVTPRLAHYLRVGAKLVGQSPGWSAAFMPSGRLPRTGDLLRRPELARTLSALADGGRARFYRGEIAERIVGAARAAGSLMTRDDLADHRTETTNAIQTTYRGVGVYEAAPPSQGLLVLAMLSLMEGFDLGARDPLSADAIHLLVESKKVAFADRAAHSDDPRDAEIPLGRLLSKAYAAARRSQIDLTRALPSAPISGDVARDTTSFGIVDGQGNAVSCSHSLAGIWGSGVMAGDTGILLNNRAARSFSLTAGAPDRLAGGRRPAHTLHSFLLDDGDGTLVAGGTPGADLGMQWSVQVVVAMLDHGLDPQSAIELPRWHSVPGTDPTHQGEPAAVQIENRVSPDVVQALRQRGHAVSLLPAWGTASGVQLVGLDRERSTVWGASDPRTEGLALGV